MKTISERKIVSIGVITTAVSPPFWHYIVGSDGITEIKLREEGAEQRLFLYKGDHVSHSIPARSCMIYYGEPAPPPNRKTRRATK